jgi:hypothetical protein
LELKVDLVGTEVHEWELQSNYDQIRGQETRKYAYRKFVFTDPNYEGLASELH